MKPTTHLALALCRFSESPDGSRWYHTMPAVGEYPMPIRLAGGTVPGIVVIDVPALDSIVSAFASASASSDWPGILIDREHSSETPDGDTGALAWAKSAEIRDDGLWTHWDWTSLGKPLAEGHVYAYRSPAMDLQPLDATARAQLASAKSGGKASIHAPGRWRPVALSSIALTNKPHFDLAPALGREQSQQGDSNMDPATILAEVRKALGIDDTADVVAAVTALVSDKTTAMAECTAAKTSLAAAQARELDAEADAFVTAHAARIKDPAAVKVQFRSNPDACKALFGCLADAAAPVARVLARSAAGTPADRDAAVADPGAAQAAAIARVSARDGISRREAVAIARRENPELWATAQA